MDVIERDGKTLSVPRHSRGRGDDCVEGEVATPAVLIEHQDVIAPEPGCCHAFVARVAWSVSRGSRQPEFCVPSFGTCGPLDGRFWTSVSAAVNVSGLDME
jgi:hypothetical protein